MKKILIVEDGPKIAMIERNYLAVNDFEADIAKTGDEGIQLAQGGGVYDVFGDFVRSRWYNQAYLT